LNKSIFKKHGIWDIVRSQAMFMQEELTHTWIIQDGTGVGIRVNDDGVDATHPEFKDRFILENSCTIYLPISSDDKYGHGTAVASLALGSGKDGSCGVGIAPSALLSACRVILEETYEDVAAEAEDDGMLYLKMDGMDISQNSYGSRICSSLATGSRRRLQTTCPFESSEICAICNMDWSNPEPSALCERGIMEYCSGLLLSKVDVTACMSFLDLFVTCEYSGLDASTSFALETGIQKGRDGKGIIYVFASGNDYEKGADTNFEGRHSCRRRIFGWENLTSLVSS
jgi:subtilisin family serine protease